MSGYCPDCGNTLCVCNSLDGARAKYKITMQMRSAWMVGYHPEHDEMFLYYVDQDDLTWVFRKGGLDVLGFAEFMNFETALILGEL